MEDFGVIFLSVLCWAAAMVLAVVIAVEAIAIKFAIGVSWPRALGDSWLMNVASTVFLLVLGYLYEALLGQSYTEAVLNRNLAAVGGLVIGALFVALVISVFIEAGVLSLRKTATRREVIRASLIANLASYFLLTLPAVFVLRSSLVG